MKQSIIIPERVTHSVFNLSCVEGVHKSGMPDQRPVYHMLAYMMADDNQSLFATAGDTLIEEDDGKWRVELTSRNKRPQQPTMEYPELP